MLAGLWLSHISSRTLRLQKNLSRDVSCSATLRGMMTSRMMGEERGGGASKKIGRQIALRMRFSIMRVSLHMNRFNRA